MSTVFFILLGLFIFFIGYIWGESKRGFMVYKTNEIPSCMFKVIYTDKTRTVLCEIGPEKRNFLVTTEVFGGKPIRATDVVRHIRSNKEMKELEIPVLGYPPLVKEVEQD
jgi:hypothetical protein